MNHLATDYQTYIAMSRYARYLPGQKRREFWSETVDRYVKFFSDKFPDTFPSEKIRNSVLNLEVMGSMRAIMTAGPALEKDNICGYNCSYVAVDDPRVFSEALYILMNGCFHPDTLIKTDVGNVKIKDLTPNHKVLNYNIETNQFEYTNPLWVIPTPHSSGKEKIELEFEDGTVIKCTTDHEFYTTNRGWVKAIDLDQTDDIKNYTEEHKKIFQKHELEKKIQKKRNCKRKKQWC